MSLADSLSSERLRSRRGTAAVRAAPARGVGGRDPPPHPRRALRAPARGADASRSASTRSRARRASRARPSTWSSARARASSTPSARDCSCVGRPRAAGRGHRAIPTRARPAQGHPRRRRDVRRSTGTSSASSSRWRTLDPEAVGGAARRVEASGAEGMASLARRLAEQGLLRAGVGAERGGAPALAARELRRLRPALHRPRPAARRGRADPRRDGRARAARARVGLHGRTRGARRRSRREPALERVGRPAALADEEQPDVRVVQRPEDVGAPRRRRAPAAARSPRRASPRSRAARRRTPPGCGPRAPRCRGRAAPRCGSRRAACRRAP